MAQTSAFKTFDANGNREDLSDLLTMISPVDTPVLSKLKKVKAKATLVEWMQDSLTAASSANAQIEGAEFSYSLPSARTRVTNNTQILTCTWEISGTQEAVDKAGVSSEFARRASNCMKQLATDIETSLINGTGNSGASGTAREMKGIMAFITTNVETGSGTGTEALTESMLNDALQSAYTQGGKTDWILAPAFQKRQIDSFTTNTRNIEASEKALIRPVDVYDSSFGRHEVSLSRYVDADKLAILEKDRWAVAELRPVEQMDPSVTGDARKGAMVAEMSLIAYNEASSAKITELTST